MLWVKAFHVAAVVAWFAGIFYLPRLFVYHAQCSPEDTVGSERFKVMERKLYLGIMTPAAIVATVLGIWMLYEYAWNAYSEMKWLHWKLLLVLLLWVYHLWCGRYVKTFALNCNKNSHRFYRIFNEIPVFFLIGILILVIVKPF
jgi:putative membrane protein